MNEKLRRELRIWICHHVLENHESRRWSKNVFYAKPKLSTAGLFQLAEGQYNGGERR